MNHQHHFINRRSEPLTILSFLIPGSPDRFFAEIGRPRQPGDPELDSFPRPGNVAGIGPVVGLTSDSFANRES